MKLASSVCLLMVLAAVEARGVPPLQSDSQLEHKNVVSEARTLQACAIECDPNDPADRVKYGLDEHLVRPLRDGFAVTTVIDNGPISNRVDIVMLGDGYTEADLPGYADDVNYAMNLFFAEEPFSAYAAYFNVHRVDVISAESGVDEPDLGIYRDTALDMTYSIGTTHLGISVGKAVDAAAYAPEADQILAMANSSRWGGTGYYFQNLGTFPGKSSLSYQVALHEFGHSFGDLADEYVNNSGTYPGGEPWQVNVSIHEETAMAGLQTKWYRWLDHPDVGTFEGAYYYALGVYRSSLSSKMRSTSSPFREVNVEQLVRLVYQTVSPIDDATPPSAIPLIAGSSFFVTPMQPADHSLDVQWSIDGTPVPGATGAVFTPDYGSLADGVHTVSVEVVDNTSRVRDEGIRSSIMTGTRSWQVQGSSPGAPTGLTAVASMTGVQLDWSDNTETDLVGYNVYRATAPGGPYTYIDTTAQSDYLDSNVTAGVTYYYVATAYSATHESGYSNEDFGTPGVPPPGAPANLTGTAGDTIVLLDWDDNPEPNIAGYKVYRSATTGGPYSQINAGLETGSTYTDTGLTNDVTYYYVVLARDTGGNESAFSAEAAVTPLDLPPAPPTNLTASAGDLSAFLDWDDSPEADVREYCIYQSLTSGGPYIDIDCDDPSQWPMNGLTPGVTYYWVVTARDNAGQESGYSNEASATPVNINPPSPPVNLTADAGFESVFLDWSNNTEPDLYQYNIYQSQASGGPYLHVDSDDPSEFLVTGLTNGVTYYFVVTAEDTAGNESGYSAEVSGTPTADLPPAAPTNLTAVAGDGSASLDWDDNTEPDFREYRVYQSLTYGGPYVEIDSDDVSEWYFSNLTNGTTYYWVVTAVDLAGQESAFSNQASATPHESTPPAPPVNLVAYPMDGGAYLDWDDNTEPDLQDYRIYQSFTSGGPYFEVDVDTPSEWLFSGLTNGTTYYWVVTALDYWGNESGYSAEASATPYPNPPPVPPRGLQASAGDLVVDLDWQSNFDPDLDYYNVYRATVAGGPYTLLDTATQSGYSDVSVSGSVTYYYVVTAVDDTLQESAFSNEVWAFPTEPISPPSNVAASAGNNVVYLTWDQHPNPVIIGYGIYRSTTPGGPYTPRSSTQQTYYNDTNVVNGTTYYYVLTSISDNQEESGFSAEVSATPDGCSTQADCDDGVFCNGAEQCVGGTCQAGTPVNCSDGIPCTIDTCNEAAVACDHAPNDGLCDDVLFCNGVETCDPLAGCQPGDDPCPGEDCDEATDTCIPLGCDGDFFCELGEDCVTCPSDCFAGGGASCGNGVCEAGNGEDCLSCPSDCNGKQTGKPSGRFCCGDGDGQGAVGCNDSRCTVGAFECTATPVGPTCCGDLVCEGSENSSNCAVDCGAAPYCGDGDCGADEDTCGCPDDCGSPVSSETDCTDGIDEDCDGSADCDDADCDSDPACACLPRNASCSSDSDCCSNRCSWGRCR